MTNQQSKQLRRHAGYVEQQFPQTAWAMRQIADEIDSSPDEPSTDEQTLRRLLALAYSGSNLYRDDGELQDGSERPVIDYKRDSVAELERKICLRGAARLAASTLKSSGDV